MDELKHISDTLMVAAKYYPEAAEEHADRVVFFFGTLKIKCKPTRPAIEAVALKYKRPDRRIRGLKPYAHTRAYNELRTVGPFDWRKT